MQRRETRRTEDEANDQADGCQEVSACISWSVCSPYIHPSCHPSSLCAVSYGQAQANSEPYACLMLKGHVPLEALNRLVLASCSSAASDGERRQEGSLSVPLEAAVSPAAAHQRQDETTEIRGKRSHGCTRKLLLGMSTRRQQMQWHARGTARSAPT